MDYYLNVLGDVGIYVILALSLNVICGLSGLLQLGHAGFYAVGAYAAALVCMYGYQTPILGTVSADQMGMWVFILSAGAAMLAAAVFALLIGIPCLRLRGDYLAIATLAFGEIVRMSLENIYFPGCKASGVDSLTGGYSQFGAATGISLPASYRFGSWWFIWICVAVVFILLLNVKRSAIGRALLAIREDEVAARAMGVNVPLFKTLAFVLCAVFAGLAGALFTHKQGFLAPKSFGLLLTIEILLAVVLGGLGSYTGSLIAAAIIVILPQLLATLPELTFGSHSINLGTQKELFFALLFILLVRFVPNGILGLKEGDDVIKALRKRGKPEAPPA